jgi:hypothetical protein
MAIKTLGKLVHVDPREVWTHEAHEFTPWLMHNIDVLAEALGVDLEEAATEVAIGDFAVDIVARTSGPDGKPVIIENQLTPTDHGHLGQLLTYAAGKEAAIVVWIATKVRDEHRAAIDWLNAKSAEGLDFFAIEIEALRIGDSLPAPNLKVVAQPNAFADQVQKAQSPAVTERGLRYQRFFIDVLARFKAQRPGLTSASNPGTANWLGFTAGRPGFSFNWSFGAKGLAVELYIDLQNRDLNKAMYDALREREAELVALGPAISWERLDNRRASRVATHHPVPAELPLDENPGLADWAVETMVRWNDVLRPVVATLVPAEPELDADTEDGHPSTAV